MNSPTVPGDGMDQSFSAKVIRDVFSNIGAKLGLVWIVIMIIGAVFAPIISNSHPFLMVVDGTFSSPMITHLTWIDVALLSSFFSGILIWLSFKRVEGWKRICLIILASILISLVSSLSVSSPKAVIYDQYREGLSSGEIESAYFAPIPYSPTDRLRDDPSPLKAPSAKHFLGTDEDGADVLSRMIYGSRIALGIGLVATFTSLIIGVLYGGVMGFYSGWVDIIMMRFLEIFESIPSLFLILTVVAFFGRNIYLIMLIIGLTGWPGYARFLRAEFLKLRQQDFVQAAEASGLSLGSILFRHMLPNGIAPLLVLSSFGMASAILVEATLSFLGLGAIDQPSWAAMLNQAVGPGGSIAIWMATFPGLAIFLTLFAYTLIGEALRDAIDPRLQQQPN
tara:strand:+ start:770 stop:1951 length:1182 start_codon:yes stop_codon:yes gene_type:complete